MAAPRQLHARRQRRHTGSSWGSAHMALALACLLAASHGAHAQAIFDLITAPVPTPPAATTVVAGSPPPATAPPADPVAVASPPPAAEGTVGSPPAAATPAAAPVVVASPAPAPVAASPPPTASVGSPPAASSPPASSGTPPAATTGNVTTGTPPVNMPPGADSTPVDSSGTVGAPVPSPPTDTLPPGPPEGWQALQKDIQIVFDLEIRGPYIVPFTNPKAVVIARVLRDRYLRSAAQPDIQVAAQDTFTYLSYDDPADANVAATGTGNRRLASRDLLQIEKSGAALKVVVVTNSVRVASEISSIEDAVTSGAMAEDFSIAGITCDNVTMGTAPYTEDLVGADATDDSGSGGFQDWMIGVIVGAVLLVLPVPTYLLVRWRRRKNKEARELQNAEAEAARQRMQSRVMRPGSKSFSLKPGGSSADIMVMSGSMGGLAGYANNGRLQSWTGSPERQYGQQYGGPYAISRATSVTSMGSALPSARTASYAMPQRTPSLPGQPRVPPVGPIVPPPGAYEEELQTARSQRSQPQ